MQKSGLSLAEKEKILAAFERIHAQGPQHPQWALCTHAQTALPVGTWILRLQEKMAPYFAQWEGCSPMKGWPCGDGMIVVLSFHQWKPWEGELGQRRWDLLLFLIGVLRYEVVTEKGNSPSAADERLFSLPQKNVN
jgi:hypothetical protein